MHLITGRTPSQSQFVIFKTSTAKGPVKVDSFLHFQCAEIPVLPWTRWVTLKTSLQPHSFPCCQGETILPVFSGLHCIPRNELLRRLGQVSLLGVVRRSAHPMPSSLLVSQPNPGILVPGRWRSCDAAVHGARGIGLLYSKAL